MLGALLTIAGLFGSVYAANDYYEGMHYARITPAVPTDAPPGKVEVVELFWYGCPHCFQFEPYLRKWRENMPEQAHFTAMPGTVNPRWLMHAKTFYALQLMGEQERLHERIFIAIHEQHRRLNNYDAMVRFLKSQKVDIGKFEAAYNSFAVTAKVQRAGDLAKRYGVTGVPSVIVAGKYRVSASEAGGHKEMIEIINQLVAQESATANRAQDTQVAAN
jgi:thiol:disulfide interchange protein DsbA